MSNYKVARGSEHLYHVSVESPLYDQFTREKLTQPYITKLSVRQFDRMEKSGAFAGREIIILHNPNNVVSGAKAIQEDIESKVNLDEKLGVDSEPKKTTTRKTSSK